MRIPAAICAICLLLFSAPGVGAQTTTIPVRAGEHQDFTRLVIRIPEENHWRVSSGQLSARLEVFGPPLLFDLTQTFSRIPRTRLRDANAAPDRLDLQLACDCRIRAYEDIPQFLVIDIIGTGRAASRAPEGTMRPPARPAGLVSGDAQATPMASRVGRELARALRGHPTDQTALQSLTLNRFFSTPQPDVATLPDQKFPGEPDHAPDQSQITQELARALAGSVSQGVLEGAPEFVPSDIKQYPEGAPALSNDLKLKAHIFLPARGQEASSTTSQDGSADRCAQLSRLDIAPSEETLRLSDGGSAMRGLYGEFDRLDADRALALVRHYLHLGFGAEARMIASLLDLPAEVSDIVSELSYLIDLEPRKNNVKFAEFRDCSPMGSLWAFLATDPGPPDADFPFQALVQAVVMLPPHLRLHLGPVILQRLAKQGFTQPARMIRSALERIAVEDTPELMLARASLDLNGATPDQARALEKTLSPETSDDALILLLSRRESDAERAEPVLLEIALSRIFALRGTETGGKLVRLVVRALTREADFAQAFEIAARRDAALTPEERMDLRHEVLHALAESADDPQFVMHAFDQRPWETDPLPASLADRLAARLTALGFDQQSGLLRTKASQSDATDTGIEGSMREGADQPDDMSQDWPGAATLSPLELVDEDLERARAAVAASRTQPSPLEQESVGAGPPPLPARQSGQTTDPVDLPRDLATAPTEIRLPDQDRQVVAGAPEQPPVLQDGMLAQGRASLEQSARLREQLGALLQGQAPP